MRPILEGPEDEDASSSRSSKRAKSLPKKKPRLQIMQDLSEDNKSSSIQKSSSSASESFFESTVTGRDLFYTIVKEEVKLEIETECRKISDPVVSPRRSPKALLNKQMGVHVSNIAASNYTKSLEKRDLPNHRISHRKSQFFHQNSILSHVHEEWELQYFSSDKFINSMHYYL
jgi:hypothetical protein